MAIFHKMKNKNDGMRPIIKETMFLLMMMQSIAHYYKSNNWVQYKIGLVYSLYRAYYFSFLLQKNYRKKKKKKRFSIKDNKK